MCRHLSPRYSYVILASGYPVLTAVNWRKFRLQATTLARNQSVSFHIVSLWYGRTDSRADVRLRVFQIFLAMGLRYDFFYPIFYDFNFPPSLLKIQPKCLLHWSSIIFRYPEVAKVVQQRPYPGALPLTRGGGGVFPHLGTTLKWAVTYHQYGISLLALQSSFRGKTRSGVAKSGRMYGWNVISRVSSVFPHWKWLNQFRRHWSWVWGKLSLYPSPDLLTRHLRRGRWPVCQNLKLVWAIYK